MKIVKTNFQLNIGKATSSKDEVIKEEMINSIIKNVLTNQKNMNMLFEYVSVKLYIKNQKWKKIMKVLYLLLALVVKSNYEKNVIEGIRNHYARLQTLQSFVMIVDKMDKGLASK